VYNITSGDYNMYMDTLEKLNLSLMEAFEKEKIEFAYPTQKLFLSK
jgi:small-conductance mechanosensitive channel